MTAPAAPMPAAPRRRRRWRRWLLILALVAVVVRLLLPLALPWLVDRLARGHGLQVTWGSLSLSLSGLALTVTDLRVADADAAPSAPTLLTVRELRADVATMALLRGVLIVDDAHLVGVLAQLERTAAGTWQLPAGLAAGAAEPATTTPPPSDATTGFDFALPLQVRRARIDDLRVRLRDAGVVPAELELIGDATLVDLGHLTLPTQLELRATSPQALDQLHVIATGTSDAERATAAVRVQLRGVRPHVWLSWWPQPDVQAVATTLGAEITSDASLVRTAGDPARATAAVTLQMRTTADTATCLQVTRCRANAQLHCRDGLLGADVAIDGLEAQATRLADGTFVAHGLHLGPASVDELAGETLAITGLHGKFGPWADDAAAAPTPFSLQLELRDWLQTAAIDGTWTRRADGHDLAAELRVDGIAMERLRPLLAGSGVHTDWPMADLRAQVTVGATTVADGAPRLTVALREAGLAHQERQLRLPEVQLGPLVVADGRIDLGAWRARGPSLQVTRRPDGSFACAGFEIRPKSGGGVPAPAPGATATPSRPHILLRELDWRDVALELRDETCSPAATIAVRDLTLVGANLGLGDDLPDGSATLSASVPGIVDSITVELRTRSRPGESTVVVRPELTGIHGDGLRPWLQPAGIEPLLRDAQVRGEGELVLADAAGGLRLQASLRDLALRDGDTAWLAVPTATVTDAAFAADRLDLGAIVVRNAAAFVRRRADSGLDVAGLALPATAPATAPAPAPAAAPTTAPTGAPGAFRLGPLTIEGARLHWQDRGGPTERTLVARLDAALGAVAPGAAAAATPFDVTLATGERTALRVNGTFTPDPAALQVDAHLSGSGLLPATLQPWLPAGQQLTLTDGAVAATITAAVATDGDGDRAVDVTVRDLALRDGDRELLAVDEFALRAPRLAHDASAVHLAELRLRGVRAALARSGERLLLPGVALMAGPGTSPPAIADAPATAPFVLPHLRIDAIDLQLEALRWTDDGAAPVEVNARLTTQAPWQSNRDDPIASSPLPLHLSIRAAPLVRECTLDVAVLPFLIEPRAHLSLAVRGIATHAIPTVIPALADTLQGTLTDGELTGQADVELDLRRRRPDTFDVTRAFGVQLQVRDLAFRDRPGGDVLAGLQGLTLDARTIDPADGTVLLRSLELETPALRVVRAADHVDCLGLRIATRTAETTPAPTPPAPAAGPHRGEIAIDTLLISGLDLSLTDTTSDPPTQLPFDALDVEVQRWSSRATTENLPFSFAASLRGGKVELPRRELASSMLAGFVKSAAQAVAGADDTAKRELRPLVEEIAVQGQLQLFPTPQGRIQTSILGLELPALRGLARQGGVEIGDGLFDGSILTTLDGEHGHDVAARLLFTYLSLTEPPGGPISTYLKLPAPIDSVLFVLRNDADEHQIPVDFHVGKDGVGGIAGAAVQALGSVLTKAVASSPLRAASAVTGLLGLGGGPEDLGPWRREVAFAAGEATWPEPTAELRALAQKLADDAELTIVVEHAFGRDDVPRVHQRANPAPTTLHALAARLRQQRSELQGRRDALAATTQGLYAAGQGQEAARAQEQLRSLDVRVGTTEAALDDTLRQLRPGAERSAERRTRAAARDLADLRLQETAAWLRSWLPTAARTRVEVRSPRWQVVDGPGMVVLTPRRRIPD